ncbi:MAG: helix-turn-helix domain-containing protein [Ilumatobacteraceae bacterium]
MAARAPTRPVVIVAYGGVQALDVTGPHEVFAGAGPALALLGGATGGPAPYAVTVAAPRPGPVATESGLQIVADELDRDLGVDTLIVPGGNGVLAALDDAELVATIDALASRARRVVSVCSGTFLLAAAGIVRGRRVTTHWARAASLAARHPDVLVDADPIWTRDGNVWTSAGVTAGIDVALALVEDDLGVDVAETIARWMVMFLRRPGTQSQFAAPVWRRRARDEPVRQIQDAVDADPAADHRLGTLAAAVSMSERHLLRRFSADLGVTPARYVANARIEAARRDLESTDDTVAAIAARVGFGTSETMRRTFVRHLGTPPDDYRRRFGHRPPNRPTESDRP